MRHKTKCVLLCQSIAVYLHLAECAVFQTHLLLLVFAFSSSPNSSEVILRVCGISFVTAQTVSHLVSPEVDGDVWRAVCITRSQSLSFFSAPSCVMLSHSHLLQPFFSQPLSHISVSFCFSYLLCPPPGSARLFLSQMFFFPFPPTWASSPTPLTLSHTLL